MAQPDFDLVRQAKYGIRLHQVKYSNVTARKGQRQAFGPAGSHLRRDASPRFFSRLFDIHRPRHSPLIEIGVESATAGIVGHNVSVLVHCPILLCRRSEAASAIFRLSAVARLVTVSEEISRIARERGGEKSEEFRPGSPQPAIWTPPALRRPV
jgi:hypothetical protein